MPLLLVLLLFTAATLAEPAPTPGWRPVPTAQAERALVVTAHPDASRAAQRILQDGGNAVDAMIAAQMVLALVEPQSSGLGGGSWLLYWEQDPGRLVAMDGRTSTPRSTGLALPDKQPGFGDAHLVGTPGTIQLMWQAHQRFGSLPWRVLFTPAIRLALEGFTVSPRLSRHIARERELLLRDAGSRTYFFDEQGAPLAAGSLHTNPLLAALLTRLSVEGPDAFYRGKTARLMVDKASRLALAELEQYRVFEQPVLCAPYRQYQVCGLAQHPDALALGRTLGILSHFELSQLGPNSPTAWRLIIDASRLAHSAIFHSLTDHEGRPEDVLGDKQTLARQAALLAERRQILPADQVGTGQPAGAPWQQDASQVSIVDAQGNALSLGSTLTTPFGSGIMVQGLLLNSGPASRRSPMTSLLVLRQQHPLLVIGSPGDSGHVLHALLNLLDWGMEPGEALRQPHILASHAPPVLEPGARNQALGPLLEALGYRLREDGSDSGLNAILLQAGHLAGAADPRREGLALAAD